MWSFFLAAGIISGIMYLIFVPEVAAQLAAIETNEECQEQDCQDAWKARLRVCNKIAKAREDLCKSRRRISKAQKQIHNMKVTARQIHLQTISVMTNLRHDLIQQMDPGQQIESGKRGQLPQLPPIPENQEMSPTTTRSNSLTMYDQQQRRLQRSTSTLSNSQQLERSSSLISKPHKHAKSCKLCGKKLEQPPKEVDVYLSSAGDGFVISMEDYIGKLIQASSCKEIWGNECCSPDDIKEKFLRPPEEPLDPEFQEMLTGERPPPVCKVVEFKVEMKDKWQDTELDVKVEKQIQVSDSLYTFEREMKQTSTSDIANYDPARSELILPIRPTVSIDEQKNQMFEPPPELVPRGIQVTPPAIETGTVETQTPDDIMQEEGITDAPEPEEIQDKPRVSFSEIADTMEQETSQEEEKTEETPAVKEGEEVEEEKKEEGQEAPAIQEGEEAGQEPPAIEEGDEKKEEDKEATVAQEGEEEKKEDQNATAVQKGEEEKKDEVKEGEVFEDAQELLEEVPPATNEPENAPEEKQEEETQPEPQETALDSTTEEEKPAEEPTEEASKEPAAEESETVPEGEEPSAPEEVAAEITEEKPAEPTNEESEIWYSAEEDPQTTEGEEPTPEVNRESEVATEEPTEAAPDSAAEEGENKDVAYFINTIYDSSSGILLALKRAQMGPSRKSKSNLYKYEELLEKLNSIFQTVPTNVNEEEVEQITVDYDHESIHLNYAIEDSKRVPFSNIIQTLTSNGLISEDPDKKENVVNISSKEHIPGSDDQKSSPVAEIYESASDERYFSASSNVECKKNSCTCFGILDSDSSDDEESNEVQTAKKKHQCFTDISKPTTFSEKEFIKKCTCLGPIESSSSDNESEIRTRKCSCFGHIESSDTSTESKSNSTNSSFSVTEIHKKSSPLGSVESSESSIESTTNVNILSKSEGEATTSKKKCSCFGTIESSSSEIVLQECHTSRESKTDLTKQRATSSSSNTTDEKLVVDINRSLCSCFDQFNVTSSRKVPEIDNINDKQKKKEPESSNETPKITPRQSRRSIFVINYHGRKVVLDEKMSQKKS